MRQRSDENGNRDHQLRQVQAYFGQFDQHQQQKSKGKDGGSSHGQGQCW
jgi:hypothetical protein